MSYKIELAAFEGPMDLLLHLINEAEIDIYDIPINHITEQFLDYIRKMEELNLEVTSEFLVMAATLIEIKSKMLVPKPKLDDEDSDDEDIDPRTELVERLIEYKRYKDISKDLREMETTQSKVYYKPQEDLFEEPIEMELNNMDVSLLLKSINNIIKNRNREEQIITISEIQREEYTLDQCITNIKINLDESKTIEFSSLLDKNTNREEIVTYFLSLLELTKSKYLRIKQKDDFSDIIITKREEEIHENG